jgi:preprotein translocase subunit SecF
VEFFRNPNIDFLGILSMLFWHGIPLGIDFRGGTLVYVKFSHPPNDDALRSEIDRAGIHNFRIQHLVGTNEVLIDLPQEANEQSLDAGRNTIIKALQTNAPSDKKDLNNTSSIALTSYLMQKDPLHLGTDAQQRYSGIAQAIVNYRDKTKGGVLASMEELSGFGDPTVLASLKDDFFLSDFGVYQVEIVGPQVGAQLRKQAVLATVYSLAGMLVYLAFRFEWIYGVAAVITVFHDTLITIGAFSLTNKPISLTVIAAILTLIGYSNNDTIVVFDRIRENLRMMRREKLADVVNRSINQTLSRTILTAGLTFLTVLALYLFGGEVLHGFSFALVIGILIGTYSSIAIAAPILVAYQDWKSGRNQMGRNVPVSVAGRGSGTGKEKAKAKA